MKLKKINLNILFCISVIFAITGGYLFLGQSEKDDLKVEVIQTKDGYGYRIMKESKIVIYQPTIPAIGEKKAFKTKEDARKVGNWVLQRMKEKKDISITPKELVQLKIH